MATSSMIWTPADGAGPGGQLHATEFENFLRAQQMGCGVADDAYNLTVTEADLVITYPDFVAVVPDGSGSFVLVEVSSSTVNVTTNSGNDERVDILVVDSNGTVSITDGTPTAHSTGTDNITDIDSVLAIVAEAPMPNLGSDEILLAKIFMDAGDTTITAARLIGRAIHTDIYRMRYLQGWVADDAQNPELQNEMGSNNLPVGTYAEIPILDVTEAFDSDGTDEIAVGYDADQDAFGDETDVSSTGVKNMAAGAEEGYVATARAVEAYYTNGGSEPTAGKALVTLPYRFVPPIVS